MDTQKSISKSADEYIYAMQDISTRVNCLTEKIFNNSGELLSEAELQALVSDLLSVGQSVKDVVLFTTKYLGAADLNAPAIASLRDSISRQITEITEQIKQIKAFIQLQRHGNDQQPICYN